MKIDAVFSGGGVKAFAFLGALEALEDKGVYTFADLERDQLKLTVADLSIGRLVVLPDDLQQVYGLSPERFSVAKAIRMSAGLPYFFRPIKLYDQEAKKHLMVDGALLSSLPLWLFKSPDQKAIRPVIGFQLQSKEKYFTNFNINNGLQFSKTLIGTMRHAQDLRYISKHEQPNIVFLDTDHVSVADFSLSRQVREELIETGKEKTTQFLIGPF